MDIRVFCGFVSELILNSLEKTIGGAVLFSLACTTVMAKDVVLYSSVSTQAIDAVVSGFETEYPNIKVSVVRAGSGSLLQRLKAEAGNPQADIIWAGTPGVLPLYKDLLEPYLSPEAAAYDRKLIGLENRWLAIESHLHVFLVNTRALKGAKMPQSWKDLLTPAWEGKIIMGNPEQSSSAYEQLAGVNHFFGKTAADSLARNASTVATSSAVNTGVARGEFAISITPEYLAMDYVRNGAKNIDVVYPKDGVFVSYFTTAIVKGGKNADGARLLYDYLASKKGRERVLAATYRRPSRGDIDVAAIAPVPSSKNLTLLPIDEQLSTNNHAAYIERWKKVHQGK